MDVRFVWLVIALIALVATLSATELVRVCAHRLQAVDRPGGRRLHHAPTARLGGIGIFWGFALAVAAATLVPLLDADAGSGGPPHTLGLVISGTILLGVGWFDDMRDMRPATKLLFQVGAATLLFATGWRVDTVGLPGIGAAPLGALALPVTIAWVVFVTNAMNLIDGLDGLAVGLGVVAVLFASGAGPGADGNAMLTAALAGALLGFLWFNLHPAMIFMGDAGSLFVGIMVAALTMHAGAGVPAAFPLIPALLVAVPLGDTLDAILRRAGGIPLSPGAWRSLPRRVFTPDSMHFHHRLRRAGFPVRQAAGIMWLAAIAFALCARVFTVSIVAGWIATATAIALAAFCHRRLAQTARAEFMAPAPIRVLYVINDLILGGAQRVVLDQASALDAGRFQVEVASLELSPGGPVGTALERRGIRVYRLRRSGEPLWMALPRLVQCVLALRPSIVHTHLAAAGVAGRIVARACGTRAVVSTQHNLSDWEERRRGWLRRADRTTLVLAGGIVAVSDAVRSAMAQVTPALAARSATVRNGIDVARFKRPEDGRARSRETLGLDPHTVTLCVISRLDRRKGIDTLLEGLARVPADRAWLLCVVGDGPERDALEAQVRSLGLAHAVRFEGAQEDVRPWLWAADVCAVPSRTEGLGVTVIEALAAGTPVFASRIGGIPELLSDGAGGRLVSPADPAAWTDALAPVIAAPALLDRLTAGLADHAARFTLQAAAVQLAAFYESCPGMTPAAGGRPVVLPGTAIPLVRRARTAMEPVLTGAEEMERAA